MAENIYSKGTRVWFEDKDHAWISAEVQAVTKAPDDTIKLVFVDERGKVPIPPYAPLPSHHCQFYRKSPSTPPERRSKRARKAFHPYETPLSWRQQTISPHSLI